MFFKAIVGLGNPGPQYYYQRHSIGFRVLDALADRYGLDWQRKKCNNNPYDQATWQTAQGTILLIKPLTFMNSSGAVLPCLTKAGIHAADILVVHDELEKSAGTLTTKTGGSHKGHNGLKSIIQHIGPDFTRLKVGIGRPADKTSVPDYVLKPFELPTDQLDHLIMQATQMIVDTITSS